MPTYARFYTHPYFQALPLKSALNPLTSQSILILGCCSYTGMRPCIDSVELHELCTGPHLWSLMVLLDGIASPSVFSSTQCQFCNAISKVAEDALSPTVCVSNKGTKQYSSPYSVLLRKATHHKASTFIYPMGTKSLTAALWKQPPI